MIKSLDLTEIIKSRRKESKPEYPEDRDYICKQMNRILRDIDKGMNASAISERYHISSDMAERICQMYLTHPHVDVEGILIRIFPE